MASTQLKLLIFLFALGLAAGCMAVAYWIFDKELRREAVLGEDIKKMQKNILSAPDPGAKRFDAAVELIKLNQLDSARDALYKLLVQFPESPTCIEARRIIGEMNMDSIFSPSQTAGKKDYIVQPGDSLGRIAAKNETTVDMIVRMNGLVGTTLQPGDHLLVVPLNFDVVVDVSAGTVTLLRNVNGRPYQFRWYTAFGVKMPPNVRIPVELTIAEKQAVIEGKGVQSGDPRFVEAEKWVPSSKPGVVFRTVPVAKAAMVEDDSKGVPKAGAVVAPETVAPESGIFLLPEDLEELFALMRKGSKLTVVR
jgi:LysM repeat protein